MPTIVDWGKGLERYGLRIGENKAWGSVGNHAEGSFHYSDEAIDVTDHRADNAPEYEGGQSYSWQERTRRLKDRARQLGLFTEVLGPGDAGHDSHTHLAKARGDASEKEAINEQALEYLATGRWRQADGSYTFQAPVLKRENGQLLTTGARADKLPTPPGGAAKADHTPAAPAAPDWRAAASDPQRSTNASERGYWQRADMQEWAKANPALAKQAMANAGADPAWLKAPETPAPQTPASQTPASQAPASQTPAPAPQAPKPEDRGALNGTRVGGPPPASALQPYAFEIHADAAADKGGRTGFIGSYLDRDNPIFQSLNRAYGNYGAGNSRNWRGGDLGGPRHGLSLIETRTAGTGMGDAAQHAAAANKLYDVLMQDPDVKAGRRPLQFFAGHADTTNPNQQGAAGGDAAEKVWNTGVLAALRARAEKEGRTNFQFINSIVDNDDKGQNTNWARAKALREQWINSRNNPNNGGAK